MKKIFLLPLTALFMVAHSFALETSIKELHQLVRENIISDKRLSLDDIKGDWLSTHFQPQIFPGSCNPDSKVSVSLDLYDAWKKLTVTPSRGRKLEPIILTKVEDFAMAGDGQAEILGEVFIIHSYISGGPFGGGPVQYYCTPMDKLTNEAKAIVCFEPSGSDLGDPCGWYSFFIREP